MLYVYVRRRPRVVQRNNGRYLLRASGLGNATGSLLQLMSPAAGYAPDVYAGTRCARGLGEGPSRRGEPVNDAG
jgi:hypothetical protein